MPLSPLSRSSPGARANAGGAALAGHGRPTIRRGEDLRRTLPGSPAGSVVAAPGLPGLPGRAPRRSHPHSDQAV